MTLLLRRTATGLFGLAVLLLGLALLPPPFAQDLPILGLALDYSYAVLAVLALAAIGGALNLGHQPRASALCALAGVLLAATFVLSLGGLPAGKATALGFSMYLSASGAIAAAGLMAFMSIYEEKRHGAIAPMGRTFRADGAGMAVAMPHEVKPASPASPQAPVVDRPSAAQQPVFTPIAPRPSAAQAPPAQPTKPPARAVAPAPPADIPLARPQAPPAKAAPRPAGKPTASPPKGAPSAAKPPPPKP